MENVKNNQQNKNFNNKNNNQNRPQNQGNKKPQQHKKHHDDKKKQPPKPIDPNTKFARNITEIKKLLEKCGYEYSQAEGSKKINCKKVCADGLTSVLTLIPMGVDRWLSFCEVQKDGAVIRRNQFDFSHRATKDVVERYA